VADLAVEIVGARADAFAAVPTLQWKLRMREETGAVVHTVALHVQVRIEPQRRHYSHEEQEALSDLFGEPARWGSTLHPFLWAHMDAMVSGFTGETEVEVPMACTYDFEVTGSKYLHSLGAGGEVPVVLLFSGTVFTKGETGFSAELVPWDLEGTYRLPVGEWRSLMDRYYPGDGWLRMPRRSIEALRRYRSRKALPTWEQTVEALLKQAGEDT
jgi:hypothetical protein